MIIPPEWSRHEAVWLTWPSMQNWWSDCIEDAKSSFATLASALSKYVLTRINCPDFAQEDAKKRISLAGGDLANIEFFNHISNDVWCRDSGAIFGFEDGKLAAVDFKYNSWGGKFPPWDLDDLLASKMANSVGAKIKRVENFICEGGALEFSKDGVLLTTDCVILNPNRNACSRKEAYEILKSALGVKQIISLPQGFVNDDTDGHIDNLARFTPQNIILASMPSCKDDPSAKILENNFEILKNSQSPDGKNYEVLPLYLPENPVIYNGNVLPATYANYLVTNYAVLVPTFAQKSSDDKALGLIGEMYSDREIVGIDARVFLREGGAVHCLTQHQF